MDTDYRAQYPAVLRWLSVAIDLAMVAGGALIILIVFGNAAFRGFGFDLAWSLEITALLMLWVTFLGCAAAAARGAHMRVTEVVAILLPETAQRYLSIVLSILISVLLLALIYFGTITAAHMWSETTTVLYWPIGLSYASLPVGMLFTLVFHLFNTWLDATGHGPRDQGQLSETEEQGREGLA